MTDRRLFWLALALTVAVAAGLFCYTPQSHGQATPAPAAKSPPKAPPAVSVTAVVASPQSCTTAGGCGASGGLFARAVVRVHAFAEHRPVRAVFWRVRERFHFRGRCG